MTTNDTPVIDPNATTPTVPSAATQETPTPPTPEQLTLLKQAFRKWKNQNRRGVAKMVLRYTRKGRPVY